ncbi:excalibur calcium-binding domain-containing protein [Actinomycetes bacterium KLBMP 9797]
MTHSHHSQPPQDPWRGQQEQQYLPPPPGTMPMPVPPRPPRKLPVWAGIGIGLGALTMLLCVCGAVAAVINPPEDAEDPDKQSVVSTTTPDTQMSAPAATVEATPSSTPAKASTSPAPSPTRVYYANCDAVRAAGKSPLRKGQAGYRATLDRDRDGIACEPGETTPKPSPKRTTKPPAPTTDPRFDTCADAKAAGYGPYVRGKDPEYYWYRDQDKDGRVCE